MQLWRISNYAELTGIGGLRASGRWHSRGRQIVYLADHPASALLEMLVHFDRDLIPTTYRLFRVAVPQTLAIAQVGTEALAHDWRDHATRSRDIGDQWLDRGTTALLQVPSAIVPHAVNVLLNPAHPDAASVTIAEIIQAPFDPRLLAT